MPMHPYFLYSVHQQSSLLNNAAFAAFLGSFTAFIFGIVAYDYTKRRERWKLHHDAVVKSERLMNRHLNQIFGNIFLLNGALDTYTKGAFSENVLSELDNPEISIDLHNLEIINVYEDYQALVEKVNHDLASWNRSNDRLFDAALSGRVSTADIDVNRKNLASRTQEIIHHMEDLMEETYTTGAYIREFLKVDERPKFGNLEQTKEITITAKQITIERKKFVKESEETMKKDREGRLKKYQK